MGLVVVEVDCVVAIIMLRCKMHLLRRVHRAIIRIPAKGGTSLFTAWIRLAPTITLIDDHPMQAKVLNVAASFTPYTPNQNLVSTIWRSPKRGPNVEK